MSKMPTSQKVFHVRVETSFHTQKMLRAMKKSHCHQQSDANTMSHLANETCSSNLLFEAMLSRKNISVGVLILDGVLYLRS
jgi:hypothetical protein